MRAWSGGQVNSNGIFPPNTNIDINGGNNRNQNLSLTDQLLSRLVDRLAPVTTYYPIPFTSISNGNNAANIKLSQIPCNGIIGTLTAGSVLVYFASEITTDLPPDIIFNSNSGSVYIPLPSKTYEHIIIISSGTNPASGKVILVQY